MLFRSPNLSRKRLVVLAFQKKGLAVSHIKGFYVLINIHKEIGLNEIPKNHLDFKVLYGLELRNSTLRPWAMPIKKYPSLVIRIFFFFDK